MLGGGLHAFAQMHTSKKEIPRVLVRQYHVSQDANLKWIHRKVVVPQVDTFHACALRVMHAKSLLLHADKVLQDFHCIQAIHSTLHHTRMYTIYKDDGQHQPQTTDGQQQSTAGKLRHRFLTSHTYESTSYVEEKSKTELLYRGTSYTVSCCLISCNGNTGGCVAPLPIHRMKRVHDRIGTCDTFACAERSTKVLFPSLRKVAITAQIKLQIWAALQSRACALSYAGVSSESLLLFAGITQAMPLRQTKQGSADMHGQGRDNTSCSRW